VEYGATDACSFCGATLPVASAPLEVVLDLVVDGIRFEYEDPIDQSAYDSEDGYLVPSRDTWGLLEELEVTERAEVLEAIAAAMRQGLWCQRNPYATPTEALVWGPGEFFSEHRNGNQLGLSAASMPPSTHSFSRPWSLIDRHRSSAEYRVHAGRR
jgi:hypothetical protein